MSLFAEILVSFLLVLGGGFLLVGSYGLAKLPSLMTRLHGPTKATTLGIGSCLIASMLFFLLVEGRGTAHELLIALFLFITAPISANMIAKAHLHRQAARIDPGPADGIPDELPAPGAASSWATFGDTLRSEPSSDPGTKPL